MQIVRIATRVDLERCFPAMLELRPHLELGQFIQIYEEAHRADGYEILAVELENEFVAVMGYRFLWDYVRGKHLYVVSPLTLSGHVA